MHDLNKHRQRYVQRKISALAGIIIIDVLSGDHLYTKYRIGQNKPGRQNGDLIRDGGLKKKNEKKKGGAFVLCLCRPDRPVLQSGNQQSQTTTNPAALHKTRKSAHEVEQGMSTIAIVSE